MSNDDELCQMFLATSLISTYEDTSNVIDITDPVLAAINMSKDDPSIKSLRAKTFELVITITHANKIGIQKYIRDMNTHKNCKLKDIPTKIIKMNADIFANLFMHYLLRRY